MIPLICLSCGHGLQTPTSPKLGVVVCELHETRLTGPANNEGIVTSCTQCDFYKDAKEQPITFDGIQIQKVAAGEKFATTRRTKHGKVGTTFWAAGQLYQVTNITHVTLSQLLDYYKAEGYPDRISFVNDIMDNYYPNSTAASTFYVHEFVRL
ncbi:MAG: hypothetical protein Q4Q53_07190 [Methanocorpusculum sp.]|nr:hypothetical protein [Methanocorpusculum sp.]